MSTTKHPRQKTRPRTHPPAGTATPRALERRLTRLTAALDAERKRSERRAMSVRRAADRRLAALVQEIAGLRHHEARAEALMRLIAERDATLAAQAERIAELESLLQTGTPLEGDRLS